MQRRSSGDRRRSGPGDRRRGGPGDRAPRGDRWVDVADRYAPYVLLAPAVGLLVAFLVYPVALALQLSLFEVRLVDLGEQTFVGLGNYAALLGSSTFHRVMWNTLAFVGASVLGQAGIGLLLAILLDGRWTGRRLTAAFRTTFLLPWATTGVIVAYSWMFMFDPRLGLVNAGLRAAGVASPPAWLGSVEWAMVALVVANVWRGVPFSLIFQTSGLQSIDRSLYDAAAVGGASRLATVRHVTLPLLRPFVLMNLVLVTLFTVNVFDLILVMTGGGPLESTTVLSLHMYETAFDLGRFGRANALAAVLFAINLATVAAYLAVLGRRRYRA